MLGLVGDVGTEVSAHDAVPCGVVLLVEFLLYECSDVLLNVVLFECLGRDIDSILLHILGHVCVFDDCFTICHLKI